VTRYLLELYVPRRGGLGDAIARADAAARELNSDGVPVRVLGSLFVPEDETLFLRYDASSADAVAQAAHRAALEFERVLETHEAVSGSVEDERSKA
jgi:hypothetical protein